MRDHWPVFPHLRWYVSEVSPTKLIQWVQLLIKGAFYPLIQHSSCLQMDLILSYRWLEQAFLWLLDSDPIAHPLCLTSHNQTKGKTERDYELGNRDPLVLCCLFKTVMFTLFTGSRTPYLRGYVSLYKVHVVQQHKRKQQRWAHISISESLS